jgi:hypothetical protein
MIWNLATWTVIASAMGAMFYMVALALRKSPFRIIDDVPLYLRPVDLEQAETLLDPGRDYELRWKLDAKSLYEVQRRQSRLFLELVKRMAHNARVLVEMGNREAERHTGSAAEAIRVLQQEAVRVRLYALLTMAKLRVWMLIHPGQALPLAKFRKSGDVDGIASYRALREASMDVFLQLGGPVDRLVMSF